jgi:hypothetical protein
LVSLEDLEHDLELHEDHVEWEREDPAQEELQLMVEQLFVDALEALEKAERTDCRWDLDFEGSGRVVRTQFACRFSQDNSVDGFEGDGDTALGLTWEWQLQQAWWCVRRCFSSALRWWLLLPDRWEWCESRWWPQQLMEWAEQGMLYPTWEDGYCCTYCGT